MAIRQPIITYPSGDDTLALVQWTGLLNTDTGAPVTFPKYPDRSVQIAGTFGTGGTVVIEGSNDGTNFATLNAASGGALTTSTAVIRQVLEQTVQMRPNVTAGDATTNITVSMVVKTGAAIIRK